MHETFMLVGGSERQMIPEDDRSKVVATLIVRTQSGTLQWVPTEDHRSRHTGLLPGMHSSEIETLSEGLRFRLSIDITSRSLQPRRGLLANAANNGEVILMISDENDPAQVEILRENDGLPILKNLYQIASTPSENLKKKIDKFLGNTAR